MTCVKTGCHIWLAPYREFVYGDAFEIEPVLEKDAREQKVWRKLDQAGLFPFIKNTAYFRLVGRSYSPINERLDVDYIVYGWNNWFNCGEDPEGRLVNSTLITNNFLHKLTPLEYLK